MIERLDSRLVGSVLCLVLATCGLRSPAQALDVVRDGQPTATIVVSAGNAASGGRRRGGVSDAMAAEVLVDWIAKMTGARLPIADSAPSGQAAIYVGSAAVAAGLRLDDLQSPSSEGLRIVCDGRRVLLAGQNDTATVRAACRLLEHWGCRYYLDGELGEVYPTVSNMTIDRLELQEQPAVVYRRIWGSNWSGDTLWKIWNGHGGLPLNTGHAWGSYVSRDLFEKHPEYFRMSDGQRQASDWYCTSNPELRKVFAEGVMDKIAGGNAHPSLSPPDGRGYCQCDACKAQDDPHSREPSSDSVCITNRYVDFYQDVAARVGEKYPDSILNFYCYADYTQAPTSEIQLADNLCAWIAPIRYCRFHRIGDPACPSRWQLQDLIDGWAASTERIAYRTYNYNLAECCVPFSMLSVWKHDIPYLAERGCVGFNLETLANWQIYGPHIYQSIRLAYDPSVDSDAMMDEYYEKFYGPQAAPFMKSYWTDIDRAFVQLRCHSGSFYALHWVYTREFLAHLQSLMRQAAAAAKGDTKYSARVKLTAEGLQNAVQYIALRDAMNRGDFAEAKRVYDALLARSEANQSAGQGNHYTVAYLKRFVGGSIDAGAAAVAEPNRLLQQLPDTWRLAYDPRDQGETAGFFQPDHADGHWTEVATYSDTLDAQGLPDRQTILWYRVTLDVPDPGRRPALFFTEVDGDARVWVNGREVGASEKKRTPFSVDVGSALKQGQNTVAIRIDHTNITDLYLGGILRPVLLIDRSEDRQTN
ncbi:MAG: DUF4838 domain-containing protein [Pirellulaceae bacterium]|nr:DUF4838 domain-containing protein [Pirellulaceae bacterium]